MRRFPGLRQRVSAIRGKGGAGELSDYLMGRESVVMGAAQRELAASGRYYIPLHDGLLVREVDAPLTAELLVKAGERELGFRPAVRSKSA